MVPDKYNNMPFISSMQEYEVPMRQLYVAPKIVEKDIKNNSEVRIIHIHTKPCPAVE